ncbi:hypothetical protein GCM10027278_01070 [Paralcaligenes ginsengisoli]
MIKAYADQIGYPLIIGGLRPVSVHVMDVQAVIFLYTLFKISTIFAWISGAEPNVRTHPGIGARWFGETIFSAMEHQIMSIGCDVVKLDLAGAGFACFEFFMRPAFTMDGNNKNVRRDAGFSFRAGKAHASIEILIHGVSSYGMMV